MARSAYSLIFKSPLISTSFTHILFSVTGYSVVSLFVIFYLIQYATIPPIHSDGALILHYIHMVSEGKQPFWDFIDIYGPLAWKLPALFYSLAGTKVWGIQVWMLIIKLVTVGIAFSLVSHLANRFYGMLTLILMTVLLGQPWSFLQTAYSFFIALPLILLTWYFFILLPFRKRAHNLIAAAFLTNLVIWTLLNSGIFLLAGGLYYCFYWIPAEKTAPETFTYRSRLTPTIHVTQYAGLVVYGSVFLLFIHQYFNKLYFLYLAGPLLLVLLLTFYKLRWEHSWRQSEINRLSPWFLYLLYTVLFSLFIQVMLVGWKSGMIYWKFLFDLLPHYDYMSPFQPLGTPGDYKSFNSYYWPQLPWLLNFIFCLWLFFQKGSVQDHGLRKNHSSSYDRICGLWILNTICMYVIYSRSDEIHLYLC